MWKKGAKGRKAVGGDEEGERATDAELDDES